jgi:tetratricopeptide (TPR) repeat protein
VASVRISTQLIEAPTDTHPWAESYERNMQDILALTSEVARAIASEIQVKLTPQEQTQLARARQVDPEAYENYLKGRFHWNKRTRDGVKKRAEIFQQAIEKDPTYAAAYAGLADCAGSDGFWGFAAPPEGCGKAKAAAQKALEIDDTAEAHASLGWAILHYDFDHLAAEREFRRAIALDSRYATAHQWYGHCLAYMGRSDEAVAETARALELDPLSLIIHASHAGAFWLARNWDRAIVHSRQALELDHNFTALHWLLAHGYQGKGMYEQAIDERQRAAELSGKVPVFIAELGGTYAAAGKRDEALQILEQLHELSKRRYVMAYWIALIHTGLREKDEAFQWLEKACQERSPMLAWARVDPRLDCLRSDPRFEDLLRCMNFPA